MHAPFVASVSFIATPDGKFILGFAAVSLILALFNGIIVASVPGWLALIGLAIDFSNLLAKLQHQETGNTISDAVVKAASPGEAWQS